MALNIVPDEVLAYAAAHTEVMTQVRSDSTADPSVVGSITDAVGPVGAEFANAVSQLMGQLASAGAGLADDYQTMADGLRHGTQQVVATDEASGGRFTPPPTITV